MSARLVLAVVLPMLALSIVGVRVVADRHAEVERAERVQAAVGVVDRLIHLRSALYAERVAAEILMPEWRAPDALLETTRFGRVVLSGVDALAEATDAALLEVPPEHRPFELDELEAVRADRAEWSRSTQAIRDRLVPLADLLEESTRRSTAQVRLDAVALGDSELIAAGTTFHRSVNLPEAVGEIVAAVSDLWVAEPDQRVQLQSAVTARRAHYEAAAASFVEALVDPDSRAAQFWEERMPVPPFLAVLLDQVEAGELTRPEREPGQPPTVGLALLEAIDWTLAADQLSLIAADQMTTEAADVAADARDAERLSAALVFLAVAVSLGGAVLFGRSIVNPVRRLTTHAERIGSGELTLEPLPLDGPPDVAAASAAFNDVVGTLHLLEKKSRALADIELDHPALREQLPGELGAALQRSTEVLSTSIAERESLRAQLLYDATHDSLTGLSNRAALMDALAAVTTGDRSGQPAALIFIDLDGFKRINDQLGHSAGDAVLQATGARISALAPAGATVSRLGGDEFVVLISGHTQVTEAAELAESMVAAIASPVVVGGQVLVVNACAGVAAVEASDHMPGPTHLLQRADLAVYDAKQAGAGSVVCYDAEFGRRVAQQTDIEVALAAALDPGADELRLVYQPIVATRSREVIALETLVRWDRGGHGRMRPDEFVPIAERCGLIVHLDRWVLWETVRQLAAWSDNPALSDLRVAVNVSARTLLQATFVDDLEEALAAFGVSPCRLGLEVTETALVTDLKLAAAQLGRVRDLGVRVGLDDFGTGFTSIAQLRALPVDEVKIDSSFVRRLSDSGDRVLVQMIRDMAELLGLCTIAEGVETTAHVEALTAIGCDSLQGYYFCQPADADSVAHWIDEHRRLGVARPA